MSECKSGIKLTYASLKSLIHILSRAFTQFNVFLFSFYKLLILMNFFHFQFY